MIETNEWTPQQILQRRGQLQQEAQVLSQRMQVMENQLKAIKMRMMELKKEYDFLGKILMSEERKRQERERIPV